MTANVVKTRAIEVLGDREAAERWLSTPKPALGGRIPIDLARQGEEQQVLELLGRIEHGVFS